MCFELEHVPTTEWADVNADGVWCPHCGDLVAPPTIDEDWTEPDECRACGYPEDLDKMAEAML